MLLFVCKIVRPQYIFGNNQPILTNYLVIVRVTNRKSKQQIRKEIISNRAVLNFDCSIRNFEKWKEKRIYPSPSYVSHVCNDERES